MPEANEQRLIVRRLKAQLAAADEARQEIQTQLNETTKFIHALIRESVEHPDSRPARLGDVLHEVKHGIGADWEQFPVLGATRDGIAQAKEPVGKHPERYHGVVEHGPVRYRFSAS